MNEAQLKLLEPFATPEVMEVLKGRLLNGLKLFSPEGYLTHDRATTKMVLLLVKIANPSEFINENERQVLEGGQRKSSGHKVVKSASKRRTK